MRWPAGWSSASQVHAAHQAEPINSTDTIGAVVGLTVILLLAVNMTQRRRLANAKVREAQRQRRS